MWPNFFHYLKISTCSIWMSKFQSLLDSSITKLLCQSLVITIQTKYLKLMHCLYVTLFNQLTCRMFNLTIQWWGYVQYWFLYHAMLCLHFGERYQPKRLILIRFLPLYFIDSLNHSLTRIRLIINFRHCLLGNSHQKVRPKLNGHLIDLNED